MEADYLRYRCATDASITIKQQPRTMNYELLLSYTVL